MLTPERRQILSCFVSFYTHYLDQRQYQELYPWTQLFDNEDGSAAAYPDFILKLKSILEECK